MAQWTVTVNNKHLDSTEIELEEGGYGVALPDTATGGDPHLIITAGRRRDGTSVLRLSESPDGTLRGRIMQAVCFDEVEENDSPKKPEGFVYWGVGEARYSRR